MNNDGTACHKTTQSTATDVRHTFLNEAKLFSSHWTTSSDVSFHLMHDMLVLDPDADNLTGPLNKLGTHMMRM